MAKRVHNKGKKCITFKRVDGKRRCASFGAMKAQRGKRK